MSDTASSEMSRMHELSAKQGRHITELRAENRRLLVEKRKAEAAAGEQICLNSELEAENERLRKALDTGRRKPVQRSDGAAVC